MDYDDLFAGNKDCPECKTTLKYKHDWRGEWYVCPNKDCDFNPDDYREVL